MVSKGNHKQITLKKTLIKNISIHFMYTQPYDLDKEIS